MEDSLKEMKRSGWPGFFLISKEKEVISVLRRYPWGELTEGLVIASLFESWLDERYRNPDLPANRLFISWDGTLLAADQIDYSNIRTIAFRKSCEDFLGAHGFPGKGYRDGADPREEMRDICGTGLKKHTSDVDALLGIEETPAPPPTPKRKPKSGLGKEGDGGLPG